MFKIVTDSTADLPVEYLKEHDLGCMNLSYIMDGVTSVSYTHLRAHETGRNLVCRLLLEKKKNKKSYAVLCLKKKKQ